MHLAKTHYIAHCYSQQPETYIGGDNLLIPRGAGKVIPEECSSHDAVRTVTANDIIGRQLARALSVFNLNPRRICVLSRGLHRARPVDLHVGLLFDVSQQQRAQPVQRITDHSVRIVIRDNAFGGQSSDLLPVELSPGDSVRDESISIHFGQHSRARQLIDGRGGVVSGSWLFV